jgi:putative glutamine amidotransferase
MTGANLKVVGWDLDNITQALESKEDNIIGLQWHPEYLIYLPSQFAIFRWLIKCTKRGTF